MRALVGVGSVAMSLYSFSVFPILVFRCKLTVCLRSCLCACDVYVCLQVCSVVCCVVCFGVHPTFLLCARILGVPRWRARTRNVRFRCFPCFVAVLILSCVGGKREKEGKKKKKREKKKERRSLYDEKEGKSRRGKSKKKKIMSAHFLFVLCVVGSRSFLSCH